MPSEDLSGRTFGRLHVVRQDGFYYSRTLRPDGGVNVSKIPMWLCECECGNTTRVQGCSLISERTKSCGCLRREVARNSLRKIDKTAPRGRATDTMRAGAYMKRAREAARLTQEDLAERAGVSRKTLVMIEKGGQHGNLRTIIALADALGMSIDKYIGHEVEREAANG